MLVGSSPSRTKPAPSRRGVGSVIHKKCGCVVHDQEWTAQPDQEKLLAEKITVTDGNPRLLFRTTETIQETMFDQMGDSTPVKIIVRHVAIAV
jgi:hypothetical protein